MKIQIKITNLDPLFFLEEKCQILLEQDRNIFKVVHNLIEQIEIFLRTVRKLLNY